MNPDEEHVVFMLVEKQLLSKKSNLWTLSIEWASLLAFDEAIVLLRKEDSFQRPREKADIQRKFARTALTRP